jgi:hypothetical protein
VTARDDRSPPTARWPNLFLVGVGKGGTSSLWAYLDQHPDVFMSAVKEPHYFSDAITPLSPAVKDTSAYLALFAAGSDHRIRGEASVSYFWDAASAPRIRTTCPDAKILVILRDPVERAHSHYWDAVRFGVETRSFADAVREELDGSRRPGLEPYVRRSIYAEPLARYAEHFPAAVHVVFFEELVHDRVATLRDVFAFLGVDPSVADDVHDEARNRFALPRGPVARRLLASSAARAAARRLVPRAQRSALEARMFRQARRPPNDAHTVGVLDHAFGPDRLALEAMLGRRLPWSTDADRSP